MALNETSPEPASDAVAATRMRSLLRRVSARLGLTDPVVTVVTSRLVPQNGNPRAASWDIADRISIRYGGGVDRISIRFHPTSSTSHHHTMPCDRPRAGVRRGRSPVDISFEVNGRT